MASVTKKQYIKTSKDGAIKEVFYGVKDCNYINYDGENQTLAEKINEIDNNLTTINADLESFQVGVSKITNKINSYIDPDVSDTDYDAITGAIDTVYNFGKSKLDSGQGLIIENTSKLKSNSNGGSSEDYEEFYRWTNPYGPGKVFIYMKTNHGGEHDTYCMVTTYVNGSSVKTGYDYTYFGDGLEISNNGAVVVKGQCRAGVGKFLLIFIQN